MYKFSSFDWDHFQINFSACLFSLLPKRFCFEVTECCVCYCNIITSVPFSGLTCWVIPVFILSPHRHASEMSSNSSLGEMPTQQAVVQSFLKNYDKVCSLWYMKENECSICISITCICNDTLNVEIFVGDICKDCIYIHRHQTERQFVEKRTMAYHVLFLKFLTSGKINHSFSIIWLYKQNSHNVTLWQFSSLHIMLLQYLIFMHE